MTDRIITVPPGVEALLFDCDGTLADTMPLHIRAWQEAFALFGEAPPPGFLPPLKGMPEEQIVALFNIRFDRGLDVGRLIREKHRRFREYLPNAGPIRPVADVARFFHRRLPMAVVSGGTRENVSATLEIIGLAELFPVVMTADDGLPPKPAPDLFLEAARRLRAQPATCLVFEDGDLGLEAARTAGMIALDVRPYLEEI